MRREIWGKWLPFIETDIGAAEVLYKNALRREAKNWHTWMLVIWHCHQAIEKSIKAVVISEGKDPSRSHDLVHLARTMNVNLSEDWQNCIEELAQYYIAPRYPDLPLRKSYPKSDRETAKRYLDFCKEFFIWTKKSFPKK